MVVGCWKCSIFGLFASGSPRSLWWWSPFVSGTSKWEQTASSWILCRTFLNWLLCSGRSSCGFNKFDMKVVLNILPDLTKYFQVRFGVFFLYYKFNSLRNVLCILKDIFFPYLSFIFKQFFFLIFRYENRKYFCKFYFNYAAQFYNLQFVK